MGHLLPIRHPNRDFFILDIADAKPKDDVASMEHPVFSLSVKPDLREQTYTAINGDSLRLVPSGLGMATIMDKDILLYCISKLVHDKNRGTAITPTVEMTAHEAMVATNWNTDKHCYKRFEDALTRLRGTTLITTIRSGKTLQTEGFGLIDAFAIERRDKAGHKSPFGRMSRVRVTVSDWTFRAINSMEVLTINTDYFRLRRPLERRLYEIARKHVGTKNKLWKLNIDSLRNKVGTNAPIKKFRFNLKSIIRDGNIPDYGFLMEGDTVIMQRLFEIDKVADQEGFIKLRGDTIDKAQKIAVQLGVSIFDLEREWNDWARGRTHEIQNADGAFMGFCLQKIASAGAAGVVKTRKQGSDARQLGLALPELARGRG